MGITLVGRDEELRSIEAFLGLVETGPEGLVLSGEPGIGKTILWEAAVERCRRESLVLSCRCLGTEASLSFGGLSDLVGSVLAQVAPTLSPPRRHALEVALLLSEPGDEHVNARAIGLALLDVVRELAGRRPLVIAVDDLQWLDSSTSRVLQMALHRLSEERVGFLATMREASDTRIPFELERSFREGRLSRLSLRGLSLAALHRLLRERLGLQLTRPELARVGDATAGNPFFALELGRELVRTHTRPRPRQPLPVPDSLTSLIRQRLDRLPVPTRAVLLASAALARPTVDTVAGTQPDQQGVYEALQVAVHEGVIELDDTRVRFTHPLLASTCYQQAPLWQRRDVHRVLAGVVGDYEERVRHSALAATGPDSDLAADLERAAVTASTRGSSAAAELLDLAAELTPRHEGSELRRRRMAAALFYSHAGESQHSVTLLERLLAEVPTGVDRADVLLLLAMVAPCGVQASLELIDEALIEAASDEERTIRILATRVTVRMHTDVPGALADGQLAVEKAERLVELAEPERVGRFESHTPRGLMRASIARLAYAETAALADTRGLLERGVSLEEGLGPPRHVEHWDSPSAMLAHRLMFRDELDRARAILESRLAQYTSDAARNAAHVHLTWLEWLSGRWQLALDHGIEAIELAELSDVSIARARALQQTALVEAHLARIEEARRRAEQALEAGRATSSEILTVESIGVLGHLELALGNVADAAGYLRELPGRLLSLGWEDPSSPLWADTIEALIAHGDLAGAHAYLKLYEERAWRASRRSVMCARRCRGLFAAAQREDLPAIEALESAARELAALPYPFEHGRTLLALGRVRRRAMRKRASREALDQAVVIFDRLGARLWAAQARSELERISGRRPADDELTASELRVASLAAEGLSNKQIASAEFLSVRTVEAHLHRAYRKLGVHSRAALARRLPAGSSSGERSSPPKVQ
jgi:DNA-binding CsgD family transcriptional regulator